MKFDRDAFMGSVKTMKEGENKVLSGGGGGLFQTDKFWKPETPKKGSNIFKMRILPNMDMSKPHWVLALMHSGIKGANGGYINEMCPETFAENKNKCPICNEARKYYATGDEADKRIGSSLWRKKNWIANIQVIEDDRNDGENNSKVFMYRFGQQVYTKFDSALNPPSGKKQIFFIDPTAGFDFLLECKMKKDGKNEFPNYDGSEFDRDEGPLANSDKEIDEILESQYDLEEEIWADKNFKTIEQLEELVAKQLNGGKTEKPAKAKSAEEEDDDVTASNTDSDEDLGLDDETDSGSSDESSTEDDEDWLKDLDS